MIRLHKSLTNAVNTCFISLCLGFTFHLLRTNSTALTEQICVICRFSAEKFNTFHPLPAFLYLCHYIVGIPGTTRYDLQEYPQVMRRNFPLGPFTFPLLFFHSGTGRTPARLGRTNLARLSCALFPCNDDANGTDSEGELIWENSSATYLSGYRSAGSGLALTLGGNTNGCGRKK